MAGGYTGRKRIRKIFGHISDYAEMPKLIEVQTDSYKRFLQKDTDPKERGPWGLEEAFRSVFPIWNYDRWAKLEFDGYELDEPKYEMEECQQRGMTYAAPLKVTLSLTTWGEADETGTRQTHDFERKTQSVFMGELPMMTPHGTFVINGTERVIVSQMHRSPGVFFDHDKGKSHSSGKKLYASRVIPARGSWLDFEFDVKDLIYVRIDRRRKLPVTTFLMALPADDSQYAPNHDVTEESWAGAAGMSKQDILDYFYDSITYTKHRRGWKIPFQPDQWLNEKIITDLINPATGRVALAAGTKMTRGEIRKIGSTSLSEVIVPEEWILGRFLARDLVEKKTGEIVGEAGAEITEELLEILRAAGFDNLPTLRFDQNTGPYIRNTLEADKNQNASREEALADIYRVIRPGDPTTSAAAAAALRNLFFDTDRYNLSGVGRVKMNSRLGVETDDNIRVLRKDDILKIIKTMIEIRDGRGDIDDIDHLGNRRVRSVGELMENQYRIGLLRMERAIRERMGSVDRQRMTPHQLINAKPATSAVREFFVSSQLSQFMDQTNPLSEVTHKRRLSALGPGGLTRERAGFEVRDVHPTHYGRICPIETPEGPNIGLINSLATFSRINPYGFIETQYRQVQNGRITDKVDFVSAMDESRYKITQIDTKVDDGYKITQDLVTVRTGNEYQTVRPEDVDLIDVSPKQIVSVATALIPFLENDDANRALMGSNMQRQAVPLIKSEAPLVGTGMEGRVARDSGAAVVAQRTGTVDQVDANRIVVRVADQRSAEEDAVDIYRMRKFQRSNQSTSINQKPLVKVGDKVAKDEIIADGPSTDMGELALGRNVLVAFMPWNGYNFEDSILISERVVKDDVFTSIHIEEFEVMARDIKLGQEEITRDIPNVGEDALRNLDEAGIAYIGAEVEAGDILVGKVTPKGESSMTPEEKLLRAIFGEKASDVRDSSLKVPPGVEGTVVEVRVFSRRGVDKDQRALSIERDEITRLSQDRDDERGILQRSYNDRVVDSLLDQTVVKGPKGIAKDKALTAKQLADLTPTQLGEITVKNEKVNDHLSILKKRHRENIGKIDKRFENKVEKLERGDELPAGVMKMVKVFIATKRKLQPGDKMAGRHGNKGVISKIVPIEDMPYLDDGTPVDIVLNPLGVPSRMNVGQILETHLGWAALGIGRRIGAAVDAARGKATKEVRELLEQHYGKETFKEEIVPLGEKGMIEMARSLREGLPVMTPVFDGAREEDIVEMLEAADLDSSGQVTLTDGRTGIPFEQQVTVGSIYMLKLHHLIDDKIHARSTGPYSLVTQQPLGGKAQFGGQRFGEMEVWALEAYGAAYTLQEMLTVKSDDVSGRTKVYESIVKGDENFEAGIPESFNVLVKELRSLGLNIELREQN